MATLNIFTSTLPGSCSTSGSTHVAGDGTTFIVMPSNGSNYYRSADGGATWSTLTHPFPAGSRFHNTCMWNGSYFLITYNTLWGKSADGITWTTGTIASAVSTSMSAWSGTRWELGEAYSSNQHMWSTDGETWNPVTVLGTDWMCMDVIWDGTRFCMVLERQNVAPYDTYMATSPDGVAWTQRGKMNVASGDDANHLFWNGALYLVANRYPVPAFSPDGITWTDCPTTAFDVIGTCGSNFVAQNSTTTFATSTDATVFTPVAVNLTGSGATGFFWNWVPCQYGVGKFATVGNSNKFATFELYDPPPPFWTSLTGTREAI